jgi:FixJ family two-component response regulator
MLSPRRMVAATLFVAPEDLKRIRASLAGDRVEVISTMRAEEAIEAPAPVILLDADGHPAWATSLRQVVEVRPTARVVVLARNADHLMWVEVLSQGAHDLLQKPLLPSEVRAAVLDALQKEMSGTAGVSGA